MRPLFWLSLLLLLLFEFAAVYFIMPMPGSQRMNSLGIAYFLYTKRWWFRIILGACLVAGWFIGSFKKKWAPLLSIVSVGAILYIINFKMAADSMFLPVNQLKMVTSSANEVDSNRLVIGIAAGKEAKAYPIRFLGYHHFVEDSINGQPVLVTYCTVCRTGRVFSPWVDGEKQTFRLVGMDHFNAMIEDEKTKSWWRQATGEAIAGSQKGKKLPEIMSIQASLAEWLRQYPHSLIMQGDPAFEDAYGTSFDYEDGRSRKQLTGTNPDSWQEKSWVVGIELNGKAMAVDWQALKAQNPVQIKVGEDWVLLVLASDGKSFSAFRLQQQSTAARMSGDTLWFGNRPYSMAGKALTDTTDLERISAYQEFWHSWKTFHPSTQRFPPN